METKDGQARLIRIETCESCPHRDHNGAFGNPAYIPVCRAKDSERLPYTERVGGNRRIADPTYEIPTWCPLEVHQVAATQAGLSKWVERFKGEHAMVRLLEARIMEAREQISTLTRNIRARSHKELLGNEVEIEMLQQARGMKLLKSEMVAAGVEFPEPHM